MQNILVSGGAGFLGSHLVERLLEIDDTAVTILDNFSTGSRQWYETLHTLHPQRLKLIEGNLLSPDVCSLACTGQQVLFHLAGGGNVPQSFTDPAAIAINNTIGSLNLFQAAQQRGIQKIIFASSSKIYGENAAVPMVEDQPGKLQNPYAVSHYSTELYANIYRDHYHIPITGLRFFNVYGPRQRWGEQGPAIITSLMASLSQGEAPTIFGTGNQSRDFVYVSDAVQACICAMQTTPSDIYNIGSGQRFSVNEILEEMLEIFQLAGRSPAALKPRYLSARPGDMHHGLAHTGKAAAELGYKPLVSMEQGLKETIQWFRSLDEQERQEIFQDFRKHCHTFPTQETADNRHIP